MELYQNQPQKPEYTMRSWMQEWLEIYKAPTVSPSTLSLYKNILSMILSSNISDKPLTAITDRELQILLNDLQCRHHHDNLPYSKSTLSKARNYIQQAFAVAAQCNYIRVDISSHLLLPKAPTKEVVPLTDEELAAVVTACANDSLGHLLTFLLETGLRRGELMALKWSDYNSEAGRNGSINIRKSKTKAGIRTVPLTARAADIINEQAHTKDGFIFHSTTGTPLTEIVLRRLCNRIREATGIPALAPHMCRHTFVTRLCKRGVPAKAIAQIIGHAKCTYVLDIYAKLERKDLCNAIYILDTAV